MGDALRRADGSGKEKYKYAALMQAGYNLLATKARSGAVAPRCFAAMTDVANKLSLADCEASWLDITAPDDTGFYGFTAYVSARASTPTEECWSPDGLQYRMNSPASPLHGKMCPQHCDIVCFESAPPGQGGKCLHSMVAVGGHQYMLPPFTLMAVVRIQGPGTWEYTGTTSEVFI